MKVIIEIFTSYVIMQEVLHCTGAQIFLAIQIFLIQACKYLLVLVLKIGMATYGYVQYRKVPVTNQRNQII